MGDNVSHFRSIVKVDLTPHLVPLGTMTRQPQHLVPLHYTVLHL